MASRGVHVDLDPSMEDYFSKGNCYDCYDSCDTLIVRFACLISNHCQKVFWAGDWGRVPKASNESSEMSTC